MTKKFKTMKQIQELLDEENRKRELKEKQVLAEVEEYITGTYGVLRHSVKLNMEDEFIARLVVRVNNREIRENEEYNKSATYKEIVCKVDWVQFDCVHFDTTRRFLNFQLRFSVGNGIEPEVQNEFTTAHRLHKYLAYLERNKEYHAKG